MDTRSTQPKQSIIRNLFEGVVVFLAVIILLNVLTGRFVVHGESMSPTLIPNQYIAINRTAYWFLAPKRGDIVVFQSPVDPTQDLLKRVVGLPQETLEFRDGQLYIDGQAVTETYAHCDVICETSFWQLGSDEFFLVGDNRDLSVDSRTFGPVPISNIFGEALLRYYPFAEMKWLDSNWK